MTIERRDFLKTITFGTIASAVPRSSNPETERDNFDQDEFELHEIMLETPLHWLTSDQRVRHQQFLDKLTGFLPPEVKERKHLLNLVLSGKMKPIEAADREWKRRLEFGASHYRLRRHFTGSWAEAMAAFQKGEKYETRYIEREEAVKRGFINSKLI